MDQRGPTAGPRANFGPRSNFFGPRRREQLRQLERLDL